MQQPIFAAIDVLEYPELHDESIPFFTFFRQLNKLFTAAGVKDFALQVHVIPCKAINVPFSARCVNTARAGHQQARACQVAEAPQRHRELHQIQGGQAQLLHRQPGPTG